MNKDLFLGLFTGHITKINNPKINATPLVRTFTPDTTGLKLYGFVLDRTGWTNVGEVVTLTIDLSSDGGTTYAPFITQPIPSGAFTYPDGSPVQYSILTAPASEFTGKTVRLSLFSNGPTVRQDIYIAIVPL